jgi:hypothetical protein
MVATSTFENIKNITCTVLNIMVDSTVLPNDISTLLSRAESEIVSKDCLGAIFTAAPKILQDVMTATVIKLKNMPIMDTNCLTVLQVDLASFLKNTDKNRNVIIQHTSVELFDHYRAFLAKKMENGTLNISVQDCLTKGLKLAENHKYMPIPDGSKRENKIIKQDMVHLLMSTIGGTLTVPDGNRTEMAMPEVPADARKSGVSINQNLSTKAELYKLSEKLSEKRDYAAAVIEFAIAKFGLLMMLVAMGTAVIATGFASVYALRLFYKGAKMSQIAIGRLWAHAFKHKIKEIVPTPKRDFGPVTEAPNWDHRNVKFNTCPKKRRPNLRGICPAGMENRLNAHGHACCYNMLRSSNLITAFDREQRTSIAS